MRPSLFDQLEPEEALAEIVAGLLIVLTFMLATSLLARGAAGGPKTIVLAAIGGNTPPGVIDAVLYLLGRKTLWGIDTLSQ